MNKFETPENDKGLCESSSDKGSFADGENETHERLSFLSSNEMWMLASEKSRTNAHVIYISPIVHIYVISNNSREKLPNAVSMFSD